MAARSQGSSQRSRGTSALCSFAQLVSQLGPQSLVLLLKPPDFRAIVVGEGRGPVLEELLLPAVEERGVQVVLVTEV